jgi:hypothetical protein
LTLDIGSDVSAQLPCRLYTNDCGIFPNVWILFASVKSTLTPGERERELMQRKFRLSTEARMEEQ